MSPFWQAWFRFWLVSMAVFALVVAGGALAETDGIWRTIVALINPGPPIAYTPPLRFVTGILGGVFLGWVVMLALVLREAQAMGDAGAPLWRAATIGLLAWFALDCTLSVLTGFALNLVLNALALLPFLVGIMASGVLGRRN
jgi:hypothetical protein